MEKRRLEAEKRDKDRQFQLEKEGMGLEKNRMSIWLEERITIETLQVEKKKKEDCSQEKKG